MRIATRIPTDHVRRLRRSMRWSDDAREMTDAMEMDDAAPVAMLRFDRLERSDGDDGVATAWKLAARVGGDFDKLLVRSEGEHTHGAFERADAEVLWSHAIATYCDTQLGVRQDFGRGARSFVGRVRRAGTCAVLVRRRRDGVRRRWRTLGAARRGRLRSFIDAASDPAAATGAQCLRQTRSGARIGSGLSDAALGLRLRYEIRRELAPYFGVERVQRFGGTASLGEADGADIRDTRWVIGLRVWY